MGSSLPDTVFGTDRRVLALAFARMADAMGNSFLIIVLPLYVASEAVTGDLMGDPASLVAGVVLALFGIASSVTQPLAGHLSDRAGRRKPFVLGGLVVFAGVNLSFVGATQYWHLFGLRIVQGVAAAVVFAPALALAGDHARKGESGAQLSVLTVSFGLGIASGQLLAGAFVPFGFLVPFGIGALFAAASVGLVWTQVYAPSALKQA